MKRFINWVSALPDKPKSTVIFFALNVCYGAFMAVILLPLLIFKPASVYFGGLAFFVLLVAVPSLVILVYIWIGAFKGREMEFAIASIVVTYFLKGWLAVFMAEKLAWLISFVITMLVCVIVYMKLGQKGNKDGHNT